MRAVLFDIYGTLFISGSGDIDTPRDADCPSALATAMAAVGLHLTGPPDVVVTHLRSRIQILHAEGRQRGIQYPEVDLVDVWRTILTDLVTEGVLAPEPPISTELVQLLALQYEARVNPAWPMPGATRCLRHLRTFDLAFGIISNAQFYTRELFPALLGHRAEAWGFDPALQYYSYEHGVAKPGVELYAMARDTLQSRGIDPAAVLYVGNDMLNDILPAKRVGFRTALFAGDGRSLRRRQGDPRLAGIVPDVVLTELIELKTCFAR